MDLTRLMVRLGALSAAALLVLLLVLSSGHGGTAAALAITDRAGNPVPIPTAPAMVLGTWSRLPVWVFVVPASELAGVDAVRGAGSATPSIAVPGHPDLRLFVLSAKSTHRGCTVGWNAQLGASRDHPDYDGDGLPDGRILDPCTQDQWDAFHRALPVAGYAALQPLPRLEVRIAGGHLEGNGFDGPVDPPRLLP